MSSSTLPGTIVRRSAATLLVAFSLAISSAANAGQSSGLLDAIHIGNFGRIDDHYFRGAQPKAGDYRDLAALGVKTVIDLTRNGRADEPSLVQAAGMKFYRIPLTTSERPDQAAVQQFLSLVNDPANQPVFVHCQGGRHRTGVMTAVYRMMQNGWTANQAYDEMKKFRFEGIPDHPQLKQFVYDFYSQLQQPQQPKLAEAATPAAAAKQ
jgi:tyrosine-protein phosphatase SIW14